MKLSDAEPGLTVMARSSHRHARKNWSRIAGSVDSKRPMTRGKHSGSSSTSSVLIPTRENTRHPDRAHWRNSDGWSELVRLSVRQSADVALLCQNCGWLQRAGRHQGDPAVWATQRSAPRSTMKQHGENGAKLAESAEIALRLHESTRANRHSHLENEWMRSHEHARPRRLHGRGNDLPRVLVSEPATGTAANNTYASTRCSREPSSSVSISFTSLATTSSVRAGPARTVSILPPFVYLTVRQTSPTSVAYSIDLASARYCARGKTDPMARPSSSLRTSPTCNRSVREPRRVIATSLSHVPRGPARGLRFRQSCSATMGLLRREPPFCGRWLTRGLGFPSMCRRGRWSPPSAPVHRDGGRDALLCEGEDSGAGQEWPTVRALPPLQGREGRGPPHRA